MSDDSNQGNDSDALGRLGENQFESWCSALQWVANRATEDRRGFDFLVYVPFSDLGDTPLLSTEDVVARREHLVAVQVKATRAGRTPRMKLSNLRHLIEHPGPSVVVIFEADSPKLPLTFERARLIRLDSTWVGESIRRHWELEDNVPTNAIEVSMPVNKTTLIDPPVALSFQAVFRSLGLPDPDTYSRDKIDSRVAAGRPPRPFVLRFTTKNDAEVMKEVADWSVGLRKNARISVEQLKYFEERFGRQRLMRSIHDSNVDHAEVEFKDSPGVKYSRQCWLDFRQTTTGRRIDLQGEIFNSRARAPFLPIELERVRVVAPGIELVLARDSKRALEFRSEFSLPPDGTLLKDCIPIAQLATFLEGGAGVELRIGTERSLIDISRPGLQFSADLPELFTRVAHALIRAQRIAVFSGIGDDIQASMEEIDFQRDTLHLIDGMTMRDQSTGTWMAIELPAGFFDGEDGLPVVLHPLLVRLNNCRIAAIVAVEGQFGVETTESGIRLSTRRARTRIVGACRLTPDSQLSLDALEGALRTAEATLEAEGYFVVRPSAKQVIQGWFSADEAESTA